MANNWAVFRQDFAGNEFLVEKNLSKERAHELVREYESHKHHQHYWACQVLESPIDYTEMLRDWVNSGSTLVVSLKVLKNQNASILQCIRAVRDVRNLDDGEAIRIVVESEVYSDQLETQNLDVEQIQAALNEENNIR